MKDIKVLGHRASRDGEVCENTVLAIEEAFSLGADGIEFDVHRCIDNFVVFHDFLLSRLASLDLQISKMQYGVLKNVKLSAKGEIPLLSDFLEKIPPSKIVNIELKEETIGREHLIEIEKSISKICDKEKIIVSSFKYELLSDYKKKGYKIGMLFEKETLKKGRFYFIKHFIFTHPQYLNLSIDYYKKQSKFSRFLLKKICFLFKTKIIFWTVNEACDFELVAPIADMIITDKISLMLEKKMLYCLISD